MRIAGAAELVLLQRFECKSGGLLLGLSLVARERHPFSDDCSSRRIVLGFHLVKLSRTLKALKEPGRGLARALTSVGFPPALVEARAGAIPRIKALQIGAINKYGDTAPHRRPQ
jgi:hypothetical protein